MQVLEKFTVSGVGVQREDWSEDYNFHSFGDTIAFYPTTSGQTWIVAPGEKIRFEIHTTDAYPAEIAISDLMNGHITLKELVQTAIDLGMFYDYTGKRPDNKGRCITLEQINI